MKISVLMTMIALSLNAFAGGKNRQDVTASVLDEVTKLDKMDEFRVYVEHKVLIKRIKKGATNTDVNGDVNRVLQREELKEKLGKKIKGKIIAVEGKSSFSYEDLSERMIVYVSFDKSCDQKECAFQFAQSYETNYSRYSYGYYVEDITQEFYLYKVPEKEGYDSIKVFYDKGFFSKKKFAYEDSTSSVRKKIKLQFRLNEYQRVVKQRYNYGGH